MYVVHTVRGSGPSRNFDLSIPFPSFRLAFFLWSTPSRSRVCLPPDPNLLLRLYLHDFGQLSNRGKPTCSCLISPPLVRKILSSQEIIDANHFLPTYVVYEGYFP